MLFSKDPIVLFVLCENITCSLSDEGNSYFIILFTYTNAIIWDKTSMSSRWVHFPTVGRLFCVVLINI